MGVESGAESINRRGFLAGASAALAYFGAVEELRAEPPPPAPPPATPVNCAVIGLGLQGRAILASLGRAAGANVVTICDTYPPFLTRSKEAAPKAAPVVDYRQVLNRKDVAAVFIATPTHQHRAIALAALEAGKNVYCESPLAHTIDDARAIATAARKLPKLTFQAGQQNRANPQHHHVLKFIRTGVLSKLAMGRAQWHRKTSWRRAAPNPVRERESNWRLDKAISTGLVGEQGIHSLDTANWFLKELPVSVTGFGSILNWNDGRDVADTVQCVIEYPANVRFVFDSTLANSYDGAYDLFMGSDAAVLLRDERAWMFKEADSPLLGWEVYARKETLGDETGIALVADATKQLKEGKIPGKEKPNSDPGKTALYFAVEAFLNCVREKKAPECGPLEGLQAAVTVIKANEAVVTGGKIVYQKEWFTL